MPTEKNTLELTREEIKSKWDSIHSKADKAARPDACHVLQAWTHLLPSEGRALDLACGMGGNALFLAECGFNTTAIDISSVAIDAIEDRQHPLIETRCQPVVAAGLEKAAFDIIVVSNYLDRNICDALVDALAPGGILLYQTFVQDKVDPEMGPKNPAYLLASNELLRLFASLKVLVFSDPGCQGDVKAGIRNQSFLVAQRSK